MLYGNPRTACIFSFLLLCEVLAFSIHIPQEVLPQAVAEARPERLTGDELDSSSSPDRRCGLVRQQPLEECGCQRQESPKVGKIESGLCEINAHAHFFRIDVCPAPPISMMSMRCDSITANNKCEHLFRTANPPSHLATSQHCNWGEGGEAPSREYGVSIYFAHTGTLYQHDALFHTKFAQNILTKTVKSRLTRCTR